MGLVTFISFLSVGIIPLAIYLIDFFKPLSANLFLIASTLTGLAFIGIGALKAHVNNSGVLRGILETLILGGAASVIAYFVGDFLESLVSGGV